MFSKPTLGSSACVAWHSILLPDVVSSSSTSLDPGEHNFLRAFDVGLRVGSRVMQADKCRHDITIASDHPKTQ